MTAFSFYEFFAGGGMVRAALEPSWTCAFANDLSPAKAAAYRANFGDGEFVLGDVAALRPQDMPGRADLAWGSFPCQDLSLAGAKAGLSGARSGAFWGFMATVGALRREGRAPKLLALENVCGTLASHGGRDFAAICGALGEAGYRYGAMVIDAALFLPQSRPRLFVVAVDRDVVADPRLIGAGPAEPFAPRALLAAQAGLGETLHASWLWWRLEPPRVNVAPLESLIDRDPPDARWRSEAETAALLAMMAPLHRARLETIARLGARRVGAVYKRIRPDGRGGKVQRAEIRFDGLAGCLRTPAGGSSRQSIVEVEGGRMRSRLLTAREAARLMGLDESYALPPRYNDAYRLAGDGVAAPVVRFLARGLFEPLLRGPGAARLAS